MKLVTFLALALTLAAPAAASTPSPHFPSANISEVGGVKVIVQRDDGSPLAGVQLFLRAGLDRQGRTMSGLAALTAQALVRTPVDGISLEDALGAQGGSITYAIEGQYAHFYIEGRPDRMPTLLATVGRALKNPDFSPTAIRGAREALGARIDDLTHNPLIAGVNVFKRSFYVNSNAGLPELGSRTSLALVGATDAQAFYSANYRAGSALVTMVGNVSPATTAAAHELIANLPAGQSGPAFSVETEKISAASKRLIVRSDVHQPWLVFGFAAPSPGSKDFGPMLLIEALFARNLEEDSVVTLPAFERGFGSLFLYDVKPATLILYSNGGNVDANIAVKQIDLVISALTTAKFNAPALKRAQSIAEGMFLSRALSLADQSWLLGNFAMQGLTPDYANAALDALGKVTPTDLQRVARRYLKNYTLAIVLPRNQQPPTRGN